jgi:1-pyrroline-5-carboxylate dehydrogenase
MLRAMSSLGRPHVPEPTNEPVRAYAPGSPERASLKAELERQANTQVEVPMRIGGRRVETGDFADMVMPHDHGHRLGRVHQGGANHALQAIEAAQEARASWGAMPFEERAAVFLRAASILEGRMRDTLNAATMLNQSKTVHQAEIDAACELIDFFRFNVRYLERIYGEQPQSSPGIWNRLEYRPLDGFVFAVTPFNFTSIAANLAAAPVLCGNTVVWKPGPTAMLSAHYLMELFEAAGLPPGVINMIPGDPVAIGAAVMGHRDLAGVHFTGSTATFKLLWRQVAENIDTYRSYPRVVGETGGKDFVMVHPSANVDEVGVALLRGAFEYQGQKCSAASRAYVPESMWPAVRERMAGGMEQMGVGDVRDFSNFMGAVIDARAFARHRAAIEEAKQHEDVIEVLGGHTEDEKGWFVHPTVIVTKNPKYRTMQEELFGPVLTVHPYPDARFVDTLKLCDETSPYALTGAIFADDRSAVDAAIEALRFSAGNFYVNDKPTGAVVGQQPFGGSRASGTNDKAGSLWNLMRWLSPRTIKENLAPPRDWTYPFLSGED